MRPIKNKQIDNSYYGCALEAALNVIGNKWKGAILYHLLSGTRRFNELKRLIPNITQRMLTLQLRELEKHEIIIRKIYPQIPPKVEYSLTDSGKSLKPILLSLREWGKQTIMKKISTSSAK